MSGNIKSARNLDTWQIQPTCAKDLTNVKNASAAAVRLTGSGASTGKTVEENYRCVSSDSIMNVSDLPRNLIPSQPKFGSPLIVQYLY